MRGVLRWIHSPDAPDLETWQPPDAETFGILLQALIGPEFADGEESFDFVVCTPSWLARTGAAGPTFLRHHLLVSSFDYGAIRNAIEELVASCEGADWNEVATKLGRFGQWEFEDNRDA